LGFDVHQHFYVVAEQVGGSNPKPPQRFRKEAFLHWAAKLKNQGKQVHAVYEACGFGFGLQRQLSALGIDCHVVCPQKLDERNRRVKTDGLDAKALCLKLDRFVQGNGDALARVRVPSEQEEQQRAIHRQREQLVAQGRSLSAAGYIWGYSGAATRDGWCYVVDAHCGDGCRFVMQSDELLTAFLELEASLL
jgi:transposase